MWQDNFYDSLEIMGKGMLGIFTVILVLMAFVYLLNFIAKISAKDTKKED